MKRPALLLGLALTLLGCGEFRRPVDAPAPGADDPPKAKEPAPRKAGPLRAGVAKVGGLPSGEPGAPAEATDAVAPAALVEAQT